MPTAQDCDIYYYLCGYLVYSVLKYEKCATCICAIQSPNAQCPEAFLMLEKVQRGEPQIPIVGALHYVSRDQMQDFIYATGKPSLCGHVLEHP